MKKHVDFKREWEKTKKQLVQFSKEAAVLAKKGEDEIVKFSKKGKLQLDSTAIGLKMERMYYLIGKEYAKLKSPSNPTVKLKKLVDQIRKLEKEKSSLKGKIKRSSKVKSKRTKKAK